MTRQLFITATGTDVGKTFILSKFCQKLSQENRRFFAIKPIISGFNYDDSESDSAKILKILHKDFNQENLDQISPWRFKAPLSPNIAAKLENRIIDFSQVVEFCREKILVAKKLSQDLLIEGAGGVMTPITDDKTYLDLIVELQIPVILVTSNYLGTISHTLTALKAMIVSGVEIEQMILNCRDSDEIDPRQIIQTLKNFTTAEKIRISPSNSFNDF